MWFIVLIASLHGINVDWVGENISTFRFNTQAECLDDAKRRVSALAQLDVHGKYACMYHNEPDREMRHAAKWDF